METWMIWLLVGIPTVIGFAWLVRKSNKKSAENHKVLVAKWQELYDALFAAQVAFAQKQVTSKEAVEALIDANTHLAPANWMVGTRRIIGSGDYYNHYVDGLKKVEKARKLAGV